MDKKKIHIETDPAKMYRLHISDNFEIAYAFYLFPDPGSEMEELVNYLNTPKHTIKDTDASYRAINHWTTAGIIKDHRDSSSQWRKFSIVDIVWIQIIAELRKFGFSIDKIKKGYHSLFYLPWDPNKKTDHLGFGIHLALRKIPISLVVFSDGWIEITTKQQISLSESIGRFIPTSYLSINLNKCVQTLFPKAELKPENLSFDLSKKETSLLMKLRLDDCDEIRIIKNKGEIDRFEMKKKGKKVNISEDTKASKIDFGEIKSIIENGKIVATETVRKEKA